MVEYSDIWWYMSYETTYNEDRVKVEEMYGQRNDVDGECPICALRYHTLERHMI